MANPWLNIVGLCADFVGVLVFFWGIYIPKDALQRMKMEVAQVGTIGGGGPDQLMKDREQSIKIGMWGTLLLAIGFLFQLAGSWPN
ncbi:MAG: hypothetical protein V4510_10375 [bacterium]